MCKLLFRLLLIVSVFMPNLLTAQGVEFNSNDNLISNRTSYNVFEYHQPKFTNKFSVEFSLSINNPSSFGYIFSIKDKNNTSSYSLSYVNTSNTSGQIKFNLDALKNIFSIPIEAELLGSRKWIEIKLIFNSKENNILLLVNNKRHLYQECVFKNSIVPEVYFGKHESVIEVPSMSIKNLKFKNGKKDYTFNLKESEGEDVFDANGKRYGKISYANWMISGSYHWKPRYSFSSTKVTSVTFDEKQQRFIFINKDSLQEYNFIKEETTKTGFKNELPVSMRLGLSIIDSNSNKLYVYEVNDIQHGQVTIANLDFNLDSLYWNVNSTEELPTQRHHHNSFIHKEKNELIIFGGFGNQLFTNNFNTFNLNTNKWSLQSFKGDTITPRYFSGLTKINENEILLFGGMGNETGDYSIGKTYYYDCYKVNLLTKKIKKLWDTKRENTKLVSSRDMVLSKDSTAFYTISYPEYIASTHLQLYKYSIKNGEYEVLGDSIPMISERIRTNANLYYNKGTEELFCVAQEFKLDGSNKVNIYSLNAPPVSKSVIYKSKNNTVLGKKQVFILLLVCIPIILIAVFLLKRKKQKKVIILNQVEIIEKFNFDEKLLPKKSNSISIFGDFTAIDKNGKDISYLFSPKIRQLFLFLFFNSKEDEQIGVTSEHLYTSLWPDSVHQKAKNLKNVSVNHLRKILKEMDGIEVIHARSHFYIELKDPFYCNYFDFVELLKLVKLDSLDTNLLTKLLQITRSGKFLKSINDECFDAIKKNFEDEILELIPGQLKRLYKEKRYTSVVVLTDVLFNIDTINEIAFYYKLHAFNKMKMNEEVKKHFTSYILNYKKLMGEDFSNTFNDVLKRIPKSLHKN
jgi:two-component SAPR family response regulator